MNAPYDKHHNTICPFPPFLLSLLNKIKSVYRNRLSAVNSTFVNKTRCYQSPLQAGLKSRYLQFSLNIKIMPSVLTLWLRAVFFPMMNRSVQPCVKKYIYIREPDRDHIGGHLHFCGCTTSSVLYWRSRSSTILY